MIDGEKITGGLLIAAQNVTVRNSWIISNFCPGTCANGTGVINVQPGESAITQNQIPA